MRKLDSRYGRQAGDRSQPDMQHGRPPRYMKTFAIAAIDGYQRFVSPCTGFGCAHRMRTSVASCWRFAKRAIARLGLLAGATVTIRRFEACAASAQILSNSESQTAAAPPEAPAQLARFGLAGARGSCPGAARAGPARSECSRSRATTFERSVRSCGPCPPLQSRGRCKTSIDHDEAPRGEARR